jgi:hypothetical protein
MSCRIILPKRKVGLLASQTFYRGRRQATLGRFGPFGRRHALCRVPAVALRIAHGQLSVAPRPNRLTLRSPMPRRLSKIEHRRSMRSMSSCGRRTP